ncbi:uncharacterized protein LOC115232368 isoform X1 [Octopus sinensis]|uniref:Uncharacterized protein LOC115232368 isoform X1 n=1 Tax=Octopus sinensis TaxID=2607531 RepID=A0A7E6ELE0_9MOLL|nr:uncharacterized protein LOC115232368 isoform X1 [Octopus sinensis]XP_036356171.1 uncharacterized protein LOC115232368 isoform X1 [Octopus sinensis]XP_036356173.1 uncharacterized protein LOC115232368 isoform X1 [Octopus sinensis]
MWLCSTMSRKQNSDSSTKSLPVSFEKKSLQKEKGSPYSTFTDFKEMAPNLESLREITQSSNSVTSELPDPEEILQTFQEGQRQGKCTLPNNVVYPPNCYGYYSFNEVVEQLCGYRKIYKHSQKKLN